MRNTVHSMKVRLAIWWARFSLDSPVSTRNLLGGKERPADNSNNLAICEPIEPRRLTSLWAYTACYRDSFTYFFTTLTYRYEDQDRKSRMILWEPTAERSCYVMLGVV
jgi:hypothetical protein